MKSYRLISKLKILETFHDSIRVANRDNSNGSRATCSVKAALRSLDGIVSSVLSRKWSEVTKCIRVLVSQLIYMLSCDGKPRFAAFCHDMSHLTTISCDISDLSRSLKI